MGTSGGCPRGDLGSDAGSAVAPVYVLRIRAGGGGANGTGGSAGTDGSENGDPSGSSDSSQSENSGSHGSDVSTDITADAATGNVKAPIADSGTARERGEAVGTPQDQKPAPSESSQRTQTKPVTNTGFVALDDPPKASQAGARGGAGTEFFGIKARGNRFVYVVDSSGSMAGHRFDAARKELIESIRQLNEQQEFYVFFYSDHAWPMFYPKTDRTKLLAATASNRRRAEHWMNAFQVSGGTEPTEALRSALKLEPDVIYLLSDGEFEASVAEVLRQENRRRAVVNTVGFQSRKGEAMLKRIADENRGEYRFVP